MRKPVLSEFDESTLRDQIIDDLRPGPILHDFGLVLDEIGLEGVKADGKYNLLPIDVIPRLDERLSRPLRLQLDRPLLKSHPYLQALHMLARATGLTRVDASKRPARLVVVPEMLEQWNSFNPAERYFNLLEAAFVHASPATIGEGSRRSFNNFVLVCWGVWSRLPAKGSRFDRERSVVTMELRNRLYLVAILDLFGLMDVQHPPSPVHPWTPAALGHTPFGDAVFRLIERNEMHFDRLVQDDEDEPSFGVWQKHFQPYFPQWRENLRFPEPEFREGVWHFKVSLGKMWWRSIAMTDQMSLDDLAYAILSAVEFDDTEHLYEFSYRNRFGVTVNAGHEYCDGPLFAADVLIGSLPLERGQSMMFQFDFGDDWRFDVKLEKIAPPDPKMKKPEFGPTHGPAPRQYSGEDEW